MQRFLFLVEDYCQFKPFLFQVADENVVQNLNDAERDKMEELMVRHGFTDLPLTDENKDKAV